VAYAEAVTRLFLFLAALLLASSAARAQGYVTQQKPIGAQAQQTPAYLKDAGIDQNLNHRLPLEDHFRNEAGQDVTLGSLFTANRPVMLALVYYKCGMLCPQVLHGLGVALNQSGMHAGHEYDVIVASIDPTDAPADAAAPKQRLLALMGPGTDAASVHFLTGTQASITDLAAATGFHYVRTPGPDGKMDQFAHSSVIMIATPDGRMSKYLSGIDYQPRDVRLALVEASNRHIGTLTDMILLYCCNYVPMQGRYTVAILRVVGLAAMGSIGLLITMVYLATRKPQGRTAPQ
jgi:protein SCO1/2